MENHKSCTALDCPLIDADQSSEINADYRAMYDYEAEDETELTIKEVLQRVPHVFSHSYTNRVMFCEY